jgi:parvulin-like peptidyl-prolyl isomerase
MVNAAHIVRNIDEKTTEAEARAAIEGVADELAQGADFAEVADRNSDCPGRGGDLGFFARGQMVPEFDDVVFALAPGDVSGIFRTPFGYHIARVIAHRAAGIAKFDVVREQISEILYAEKRQRVIDRFIDQLRAKASIET